MGLRLNLVGFMLFFVLLVLSISTVSAQLPSELYTRYYDALSEGTTTVFVENVGVPITKIDLVLSGAAYNVRFYFNSYSYNPSNLPIQENVYTYVHIIAMNLDIGYIQPSIVEFRVEKKWLGQNSISEIALYLLKDNQWHPLPTEKVGEDSSYNFYHATTTEFGYFSFAGQKSAVQEVVTPVVESVPEPEAPEPATEEIPQEETPTEPVLSEPPNISATVYIMVMLAAILSGGGLALFLYKDQIFKKQVKIAKVKHLEDVPDSQKLILNDKTELHNLYDLEQVLSTMSEALFSQHALAGKNDFAQWVKKALNLPELATKLNLSSTRMDALRLVQEECAKIDCGLYQDYFITKYQLHLEQYTSLYLLVAEWKRDNVSLVEIRNRLQLRHLPQGAIEDFLYGPPDQVEDFTIHQEDEGAINLFLFDAISEQKAPDQIKRELLDAGWPRVVVERKIAERFMQR